MSEAVRENGELPTVYEWYATCVEHSAANLACWVATTPEDRLDWVPAIDGFESKARSIYSQVSEIAQLNRRFALLIGGGTPGEYVRAHSYASSELAQEDLKSSASEFAEAVRNLKPEDFAREIQMMRGKLPLATALEIALANTYYHGGQFNLIQMLLGDGEFHRPEG